MTTSAGAPREQGGAAREHRGAINEQKRAAKVLALKRA